MFYGDCYVVHGFGVGMYVCFLCLCVCRLGLGFGWVLCGLTFAFTL